VAVGGEAVEPEHGRPGRISRGRPRDQGWNWAQPPVLEDDGLAQSFRPVEMVQVPPQDWM
jgi:hypothetical protein